MPAAVPAASIHILRRADERRRKGVHAPQVPARAGRAWAAQRPGVGDGPHARRSRDAAWTKCETWQYITRVALARIFYIQLRFFGFVPVLGRDTYRDGRGRMLVRLLDRFTVGDGTGEGYDIGELVTYLNDGILLAPSMLLVPEVCWSEGDARSFDVELTDQGRTVKARVFVDELGAPVDFETTDRFFSDAKDPSKATRCRWTTPTDDFEDVGERRLLTRATAIWHPPEGDVTYADFTLDPASVAFNVAPGA